MSSINIHEGDITLANVDAIVNAANPQMLGGGGVDGAIHRAAGPELLEACRQVNAVNGVRCPTGEARLTIAARLPSRFVIHTVGPVYHQEKDPAGLLASAYRRSLQLALEYDCQSIAFPAISCGVYGYPHEAAARIALSTCSQEKWCDLEIDFYLFGEGMRRLWQRVWDEIRG